jgi:hypothetical protein
MPVGDVAFCARGGLYSWYAPAGTGVVERTTNFEERVTTVGTKKG